MGRRARSAFLVVAVLGGVFAQVPAQSRDLQPQYARGLTVPAGFAAAVYAQAPIVSTTLTFGPNTASSGVLERSSDDHGSLLYVGGAEGAGVFGCSGCGRVVAIDDERQLIMHDNQPYVATGLNQVLGIAFRGNTLWVTDNANSRGRVLALNDTNADGFFETQRVVLKNIPNGRHQTNGLTVGPDGMVYVANGNATDDGLECGPPLPPSNSVACPPGDVERKPWTGSIIRVDPDWNNVDLLADVRVDGDRFYAADGMDDESVLVSSGYRNIYDVDFNPRIPDEIWTPMNGPDDPSGSEPIYGLDVDNEEIVGFDEDDNPIYGPVIEDAGFPSCLYDPHNNVFPMPAVDSHTHDGNPVPQENPNTAVTSVFGPCPVDTVLRPRTVLSEGHEGTSGAAFERGANFPARYDGDLFIAEWGSLWNLNAVPPRPNGHRIVRVQVEADGTVSKRTTDFMTGILPMDVVFGPDGLMYVADMDGTIYNVLHAADPHPSGDVMQVTITDPAANGNPQFSPQVAPIFRGQTIRWVNNTTQTHTIEGQQGLKMIDPTPANSGGVPTMIAPALELNSGPIPPGGSYTFTFDGPAGIYQYISSGNATRPEATRGFVVVVPMER